MDRLRRALDETLIGGVQTDAGFLRWLVDRPEFIGGAYDTGFIADHWPDGRRLGPEEASLAAAAAIGMRTVEPATRDPSRPTAAGGSAWGRAGRLEARRG